MTKYEQDMVDNGWKMRKYPHSTSFTKPLDPDIIEAMKKASREGKKFLKLYNKDAYLPCVEKATESSGDSS